MDQECEKEDIKEKAAHPPVLVKGYMRPDGTSYYVVIPKEIRTILNLKGGEYFIMKAVPEKGGLKLKLVQFADEEMGMP
ncbi:MAG: AbrB/MazE/SpoVT family DNA-binding domain-containing protein [Halobacteriota archaeon]